MVVVVVVVRLRMWDICMEGWGGYMGCFVCILQC